MIRSDGPLIHLRCRQVFYLAASVARCLLSGHFTPVPSLVRCALCSVEPPFVAVRGCVKTMTQNVYYMTCTKIAVFNPFASGSRHSAPHSPT